MLSPFPVSPPLCKLPIPFPNNTASMRVLHHPLTHSHLTALASSMLRHQAFTGPRASPPIDAR